MNCKALRLHLNITFWFLTFISEIQFYSLFNFKTSTQVLKIGLLAQDSSPICQIYCQSHLDQPTGIFQSHLLSIDCLGAFFHLYLMHQEPFYIYKVHYHLTFNLLISCMHCTHNTMFFSFCAEAGIFYCFCLCLSARVKPIGFDSACFVSQIA